MSRKYKNPPIVEAVCEIRLTEESKWDIAVPGLVYEKVKHRFPDREPRPVKEEEISYTSEGVTRSSSTEERILLYSSDRKTFIQIGSRLMAAHRLRPYLGWDHFEPDIRLACNALNEVVDVNGVKRIGLRYINRIEIAHNSFKLEEYFNFRPYLEEKLREGMTSFIVGSVVSFAERGDVCKFSLVDIKAEKPDAMAFILDLDYYLDRQGAIQPNCVFKWIETAHHQIQDVFESCIQDPLRRLFGEE